ASRPLRLARELMRAAPRRRLKAVLLLMTNPQTYPQALQPAPPPQTTKVQPAPAHTTEYLRKRADNSQSSQHQRRTVPECFPVPALACIHSLARTTAAVARPARELLRLLVSEPLRHVRLTRA